MLLPANGTRGAGSDHWIDQSLLIGPRVILGPDKITTTRATTTISRRILHRFQGLPIQVPLPELPPSHTTPGVPNTVSRPHAKVIYTDGSLATLLHPSFGTMLTNQTIIVKGGVGICTGVGGNATALQGTGEMHRPTSFLLELIGIRYAIDSISPGQTILSDCEAAIGAISTSIIYSPTPELGMITESRNQPGKKVRWTGGHPERRNAMIKWTDSDWGNHLADRVAAGEHPPEIKEVETIPLSSYVEKLQSSYNHWHIRKHGSAFLGSITHLAAATLSFQYYQQRDAARIKSGKPAEWFFHTAALSQAARKTSGLTMRQKASWTRILLKKLWLHIQSPLNCPVCNEADTLDHWIIHCRDCTITAIREKTLVTIDKIPAMIPTDIALKKSILRLARTSPAPFRLWCGNLSIADATEIAKTFPDLPQYHKNWSDMLIQVIRQLQLGLQLIVDFKHKITRLNRPILHSNRLHSKKPPEVTSPAAQPKITSYFSRESRLGVG